MERLFGTDGIRGIANRHPMTPQTGLRLGRALVQFLRKGNVMALIGRDTRLSGPMLEYALASGLMSEGAQVGAAGVLPTPAVACLTKELGADVGIVVSASHNPFDHNGFKVFSSEGTKLREQEEQEIEEIILSLDPESGVEEVGSIEPIEKGVETYIEFLVGQFPNLPDLGSLGIVIDCANGATYRTAPCLFEKLNTKFMALGVAPDGKNINEGCGSQHPVSLAKKVIETGAVAGLAFDGDGDRLVAVDEKGHILTGDQLLVIFAKMLKDQGRLKGNLVISTVMSNIGLRIALESMGIDHVATAVGDRNVYQEMVGRGAVLGGEESGHIIFLQYHSTGDGMLSALQLLNAMKYFDKPLSELGELMEVFPQVLINVPVTRKPPLSELPAVQRVIKDVQNRLGNWGRVLVRYSGTESLCRVMVEGQHQDEVENYAREIASAVAENLGRESYSNSSDSSLG